MQPSNRISLAILASTAIVVAGSIVSAQLEISRSTVDSGGGMRSTGGTYELSGTIGQPDAGVANGGSFALSGGFWFGTPPGDGNDDGVTNLLDLPDLEGCMVGPAGAPAVGPCRSLDLDGSGEVDLMDFAAMQLAFGGG